ncbi:podocan-like [Cataglyphis hispanica]|uniref:podocan-like n=1 Tax=Cataglyphis hispanica TaxID=1086592 RepID=UPI002180410E|nr:podocan-like [Cataglyphis hispanica]
MRLNIMKFSFTIIIFISWSMLSTANDVQISLEFPNYMNEFGHLCKNEMISFNFTNAKIMSISRNFISSPWITCLNFTNTHLEIIEKGAFNNLPNLTQLILSNNNLNVKKLFDFGGHENLKLLILNSATTFQKGTTVNIFEEYPNLEILSMPRNYIHRLQTSTDKTPFPKLKILDLSGNNNINNNFLELLPNNLRFLDLHDNSLTSLAFAKRQVNLLALNLNNNNLVYVKKDNDSREHLYNLYNRRYRYNMYEQSSQSIINSRGLIMTGLENLQYLSISANQINDIESNAFEDTNKLVYLNLSKNEITSLHSDIFEKLQSLRLLDLSSNKLKIVPQISNETVISIFSLNYNNIKNVMSNAFVQMPKLTKLLLRGNQIDEINVKAFAQLSLLKILDLSKNKLSLLPEGFSESLTSLKYLNVEGNQFTSLESLSLTSVLSSMEVYVAMNPIKYLNVDYLKSLPQNLTVNLVQESSFALEFR